MMLAYAILIYFCLSPRSLILTLLSQLKKMKCINKTIQRNTLIYIKENGIDTINASGFSHTHTHTYKLPTVFFRLSYSQQVCCCSFVLFSLLFFISYDAIPADNQLFYQSDRNRTYRSYIIFELSSI